MLQQSISSAGEDEDYVFDLLTENVIHPLDITSKIEPDEIMHLKNELTNLKNTNPAFFSKIIASVEPKEG